MRGAEAPRTRYTRPALGLLQTVEAQAPGPGVDLLDLAVNLLVNEALALYGGRQKDAAERLGVGRVRLNHYLKARGARPKDERGPQHGDL